MTAAQDDLRVPGLAIAPRPCRPRRF